MKPNPRQQPTDPQPATPSATLIDVDRTTAAPRRWRHTAETPGSACSS
jgi:hypothetical protein